MDKTRPQERKFNYDASMDKKIEERMSMLNHRREDYRKVLEKDRSTPTLMEDRKKNIETSVINIDISKSSDRSDESKNAKDEGNFKITLIPVEDEKMKRASTAADSQANNQGREDRLKLEGEARLKHESLRKHAD